MYTQGYTDETLTNFTLEMSSPSIILEQEKIELLKSKTELSGTMLEQVFSPIRFGFMIMFIILAKTNMMNIEIYLDKMLNVNLE